MSYCNPADKPIVYFKFAKEKSFQKIRISEGPLEARINKKRIIKPGNPARCWRFHGMSLCPEPSFKTEFFAYGLKPVWEKTKSRACPEKEGGLSRPMIDGRYVSSWFEEGAKTGTEKIEEVELSLCPGAGDEVCELQILHRGAAVFTKEGDCPCEFDIKCGEECPTGQIKGPSNRPPGYCCISCDDVRAQISAIQASIRRANK